jgi:hypothetical protein
MRTRVLTRAIVAIGAIVLGVVLAVTSASAAAAFVPTATSVHVTILHLVSHTRSQSKRSSTREGPPRVPFVE